MYYYKSLRSTASLSEANTLLHYIFFIFLLLNKLILCKSFRKAGSVNQYEEKLYFHITVTRKFCFILFPILFSMKLFIYYSIFYVVSSIRLIFLNMISRMKTKYVSLKQTHFYSSIFSKKCEFNNALKHVKCFFNL